MKTFQQYLQEAGGASPGHVEVAKTSVDDAYFYASKVWAKYGRDIDEELPNFRKNYLIAKTKAMFGYAQRKDMPVIERQDVLALQYVLKNGSLDIQHPWSSSDVAKDPFPEGLSGDEADFFLKRGLKLHDGDDRDDVVAFKNGQVAAQKLIPIQKQIYLDKSVERQAKEGAKGSRKFMMTTRFLCSSDLRILDGHHRFISSLFLNPQMKVSVLMINMPIDKLLPLTLAFSDAIGNKRNG